MNADRLLALYDRVADAPDAVSRLRQFVLDLAVRGKLVEQDPADEPASELLRRIAVQKARLLKEGEIRKPRVVAPLDEDEVAFSLPTGWAWTQIAQLGVISPRNEAPDDHQASFVPMSLIAAEYGVGHQHETRLWGDIRKGYTHFAEGDVGLAKITPCFENGKSTVFRNLTGGIGSGTTELHVIRPLFVTADYIALFLKSSHFIDPGISRMTGTAGQKRVPTEYFTSSAFPLPPLAEEHRIVAKVDELMALCDRLEETRTAREDTRDRLTLASLTRLSAPDTDAPTFRSHARFAVDALPALTARADQIKHLRQAIRNLAVRGKLVEQDPADQPASGLLKRIALEKPAYRTVTKPTANLIESITGYDIPSGWVVTTLQSVCASITDGDHLPPPKTKNGIPFLVIGDVRSQSIKFLGSRFVSPEYYEALDPIRRPRSGDLLYTLVGSYGIPIVVRDDQPFCVQRHIGILRPSKLIDVEFLACAMESSLIFEQATACATGIAQKTVPLSGLRRFVILLPPLGEQHRIVARVDGLMPLCDRMEADLATADDIRNRLLESLLHDAFRMFAAS